MAPVIAGCCRWKLPRCLAEPYQIGVNMARDQWPEVAKTEVTDGHKDTENAGGEQVGYARFSVYQAEQQG